MKDKQYYVPRNAWEADCLRWRGCLLTGKYSHWCPDWDYLPIDETTPEWPCVCEWEKEDASIVPKKT